jgi:hypothetical protein
MAVTKSKLETDLKNIFRTMQDGSKTDDWLAAQLADAISKQILTAEIAAGKVIVSVSGGSGAPAVGVSNPAPIGVK